MKTSKVTGLFALQYAPERLFEHLYTLLGASSYSALSRQLGISPSAVCKLRHRERPITAEILLKVHEATGIPLRELRRWMGDTRPHFAPVPPSALRSVQTTRSSGRARQNVLSESQWARTG